MAYKGFFRPRYPEKYGGNPHNIVYRSQWELKVMMQLDHDPKVIEWGSEELSVPYFDPTRGTVHRYYPDFKVKYQDGKTYLVEIKPHKQTKPSQAKNKRRHLKESITYARNVAKWKSAKVYCEDRDWKFIILTEKEIFGKLNK